FLEVHVDCGMDELTRRDPKGLYAKAEAGEVANLTGVTAPYEAPEQPEIVLRTDAQTVDDAVARVMEALRAAGVPQACVQGQAGR
ncbi:MAG TPA: adenylyl-sulfate kinase, partial [Longimicrobium sp.]